MVAVALMQSNVGREWLEIDEPTKEAFEAMSEFIGHMVNQETWLESFEEVGGSKSLNSLMDIGLIQNDLTRAREVLEGSTSGGAYKGVMPIRLIPTRGPLLELSGHIGDACWASKYDSIAESYPNISAVIMVQNPDKPTQRMAGSALLIEAESDTGEPILIMRGINPIQNLITKLSAEDFYLAFKEYCRGIADAQGRRLVVVIDDHSGGSTTNRPDLYQYLDTLRSQLQPLNARDTRAVTFNGYTLEGELYFA
jgi:hypothetical protein